MFFFLKEKTCLKKTVFAGLALLLVTGLLFVSCGGDDNFVDDHKLNSALIGTWESEYFDSYIITLDRLDYDMGGGYGGYGGIIRHVTKFTDTAGVIIIQYDADKKPSYFTQGKEEPKGDFSGIYYEDLMPNVSVKMGQAIDLTDYSGAEETTLDAAIAAFTSGKRGDYIGEMGTYLKQ